MHDVICAQNCNVGKITVNVSQKSEKAKNRIYEIFPWISVRWSNDVETDFIACWGKPVQAVADPKILKMGGGAEDNLLAPSLMRTTKYMPFTRKKAAFWKKNYTIGGGRPQAPPLWIRHWVQDGAPTSFTLAVVFPSHIAASRQVMSQIASVMYRVLLSSDYIFLLLWH